MLTVVCWKWRPLIGYRSQYTPETVYVLRDMVRRNYSDPHRFVCVTDDATGLDGIETLPLWTEFAHVPSPHGDKNPSCYRRLRLFHPDAASLFGGERLLSIDLDTVILGDLRPLWNRPEDFVAWGDTNPRPGSHYNGSMMLLRAGTRRQVWDRFDPMTSPRQSLKAGCWGSDQGWISYCLGPGEPKWTKADGVYSYRNDLKRGRTVPANATVVSFHGRLDPWHKDVAILPWVAQHYRREPLAVAS